MTITKLIENEKKLHPQAKLQDYYKMFYQAVFGPAHILKNTQTAYEYLLREIQNPCGNNIQDISFLKNDFIRVDLGLINDVDIFFELLLKSAEMSKGIPVSEWIKLWEDIVWEIQKYGIKDFEIDYKKIKSELLKGNLIFHHSNEYKNNYNPHYRVVSAKLWENI